MAKRIKKVTVRKTTRKSHEYEAGYRRTPESRREIEAAQAAAVRLLSREDG